MTFHPGRPIVDAYHFPPAYVPTEISRGVFPSPQRVFDVVDRLMSKEASSNPHDHLVSRALLLELLLELLDRGPRKPADNDGTQQLAEQVRTILESLSVAQGEKHIRETLARVGYRYEYLLRVFYKAFGMTPNKYVTILRLERAKLLLRDTDWPIGTIAARIGLQDPGYFSKIFRAHVGLLPSEYRARDQ